MKVLLNTQAILTAPPTLPRCSIVAPHFQWNVKNVHRSNIYATQKHFIILRWLHSRQLYVLSKRPQPLGHGSKKNNLKILHCHLFFFLNNYVSYCHLDSRKHLTEGVHVKTIRLCSKASSSSLSVVYCGFYFGNSFPSWGSEQQSKHFY